MFARKNYVKRSYTTEIYKALKYYIYLYLVQEITLSYIQIFQNY